MGQVAMATEHDMRLCTWTRASRQFVNSREGRRPNDGRMGAGKEQEEPRGGVLLGDTTASPANGARIVLSNNCLKHSFEYCGPQHCTVSDGT